MDTRRKIQFYINAQTSPGEAFADELTGKTAQGERGRLWKAAMLSGFALQRIDPRLPHILSELLSEQTTAEEVIKVIQAVSPKTEQTGPNKEPVPASSPQIQSTPDHDDETRKNALGMFKSTE